MGNVAENRDNRDLQTRDAMIKSLVAQGYTMTDVGRQYNLTHGRVSQIVAASGHASVTVPDLKKALQQYSEQDLPRKLMQSLEQCLLQLTVALSDPLRTAKLSPYQLAGMVSLLTDKFRLCTGQSTHNIATSEKIFIEVKARLKDKVTG